MTAPEIIDREHLVSILGGKGKAPATPAMPDLSGGITPPTTGGGLAGLGSAPHVQLAHFLPPLTSAKRNA